LPISWRKRIATSCQNANDLAREAVGWNDLFGGTPALTLLKQLC
jgi:hypothetical protein